MMSETHSVNSGTSGTPTAIPRSARPFSPSPPRENRHTSSRPPSILFGAPPVGTVAPSTNFSLDGLPSTPSPYLSMFEPLNQSPDNSFFGYADERRGRKESGFHGGRRENGMVEGEFSLPHPETIKTGMERSESVSTTSSSSPPLGATSILAALTQPSPPSLASSTHRPRTPDRSHDHPTFSDGSQSDHQQLSLAGLARSDAPASPQSLRSVKSNVTSSSLLSSSKSAPRLHQPTVVRSKSGRGISFLPPPAHVSPTADALKIHQPSSHRASLPAQVRVSPKISSEHDETMRHSTGPWEGRARSLSSKSAPSGSASSFSFPLLREAEDRDMDGIMRDGLIRVASGHEAHDGAEPIAYGGGPTQADVKALEEMVEVPQAPEIDEADQAQDAQDVPREELSPSTRASTVINTPFVLDTPVFPSPRPEEPQEHLLLPLAGVGKQPEGDRRHAALLESAAEHAEKSETLSLSLHSVTEQEESVVRSSSLDSMVTLGENAEVSPPPLNPTIVQPEMPEVHRDRAIDMKEEQATDGEDGDRSTVPMGKQAEESEEEVTLNEVPEPKSNATLIDEYVSATIDKLAHPSGEIEGQSTDSEAYAPPYKIRSSASRQIVLPLAEDGEKFSLVFLANITSYSTDGPLPFNTPRVEVRLAWKDPKNWVWVPGRSLIPDWDLKYVHGEVGLVRLVAQGVVKRLPVVWRLAAWL